MKLIDFGQHVRLQTLLFINIEGIFYYRIKGFQRFVIRNLKFEYLPNYNVDGLLLKKTIVIFYGFSFVCMFEC